MAIQVKTKNGVAYASLKTLKGLPMKGIELSTTTWGTHANLTAYYRFESGALTTDSSGDGNTLTAISDPAETTGKFGGGVILDSDDAYSITNHTSLRPTGNFTIGAWINQSSTSGTKYIFQSYSNATGVIRAGISIACQTGTGKVYLTSGKNTGDVQGTDYQQIISTSGFSDGTWHFAVATYDGSYLRIYKDGILDGSVAWTYGAVYNSTNYVRIGCNCNSGTNQAFFGGSLDDVFLLKGTALSETEVLALYQSCKTFNGINL